jgi:hypothetical protein
MMTRGACLLVAVVVLVQSSLGAQALERRLRGSNSSGATTVTTTAAPPSALQRVSAALPSEVSRWFVQNFNETAAVDDEQPPAGHLPAPQAPDEGCKEAVEQVREAFQFQTHCRLSTFMPISCHVGASAAFDQVAAGMNYYATVDVHPCEGLQHGFAHLRIYKGENVSAILLDEDFDVETKTSVVDFFNETSGETPGAATENVGNGTFEAMLGSGQCVKANEPCPSDQSRCCSGSCGPMGGYVTGFLPMVCQ